MRIGPLGPAYSERSSRRGPLRSVPSAQPRRIVHLGSALSLVYFGNYLRPAISVGLWPHRGPAAMLSVTQRNPPGLPPRPSLLGGAPSDGPLGPATSNRPPRTGHLGSSHPHQPPQVCHLGTVRSVEPPLGSATPDRPPRIDPSKSATSAQPPRRNPSYRPLRITPVEPQPSNRPLWNGPLGAAH